MSDPVYEYLAGRGCPDFVVAGRLPGLVSAWERVTQSVALGEEQEQDDYLNDVDGRQLLEDVLPVSEPALRSEYVERIVAADHLILKFLIPTSECLWGKANAVKYGYARDRNWWYYHRPRAVDSTWRTF